MKLVLFGGVHGVGKTTLLTCLTEACKEHISFFDPGEYFWTHVYEKKDLCRKDAEMLVAEEIKKEVLFRRLFVIGIMRCGLPKDTFRKFPFIAFGIASAHFVRIPLCSFLFPLPTV